MIGGDPERCCGGAAKASAGYYSRIYNHHHFDSVRSLYSGAPERGGALNERSIGGFNDNRFGPGPFRGVAPLLGMVLFIESDFQRVAILL